LLNSKELKRIFLSKTRFKEIENDELFKSLRLLSTEGFRKKNNFSLVLNRLENLKKVFEKIDDDYKGSNQQDAMQYLACLLYQLQERANHFPSLRTSSLELKAPISLQEKILVNFHSLNFNL
jgi:hypothetical protein